MALIDLSENADLSLVGQIVMQMKQLIDLEVIRSGSRVTSIRNFARDHGVSTYTVAEAYERLVAESYFKSRPRSGYFVAREQVRRDVRAAPIGLAGPAASRDPDWLHRQWLHDAPADTPPNAILASGALLPPKWFAGDGVRSGLKSIAAHADLHAINPTAPYGYAPLCELLRARMAALGVCTDASQIMLTDGATHAFDLLIRCFLKTGDSVLVEDPGYFPLFHNLRLHGVHAISIDRRVDGPDLDQVETLARQHHPAMMFTQSMLHDPTGSCTTPANAHRLLKLAEQYAFRLVEDDVYADLLGQHATRIATLDQLDRVLYVGSFSKAMSPALRVGFIAGDAPSLQIMARQKMAAGTTGSHLDQRLVHAALMQGHYRRDVGRLRERLSSALQQACAMLDELGLELFCRPQGGKFVWVRVPGIDDSEEICRRAAQHNISIAPGRIFRSDLQPTPWFRLNVAYCKDPAVTGFLRQLIDAPSTP